MDQNSPSPASRLVLVSGATGYVGGRLVPHLLQAGYRVRCLVRDRDRAMGRSWAREVEMVEGDVLEPSTLKPALEGVDVAYYLVHSMRGGDDYAERDRRAARNFANAAAETGVQQIIYLGGLGDPSAELSQHLRSRQDTGRVLAEGSVPVTELRAGVVVGSGSLSFEIIRDLTERLPFMICPRWVYVKTQPIAVRDLLAYLVASIDRPAARGRVLEIGGSERLTYGEMILGYAEVRGLVRRLQPVPVLTPRLSSYWLHLVTPVPATIARPLVLGLRNESVVRDDSAREVFPEIQPRSYREAVERALSRLEAGRVETAWSDALVSSQGSRSPKVLTQQEGMIFERRFRRTEASPARVFAAFTRLGGRRGWPAGGWAWQLRGLMDRLVGGVGMRRGRRHPTEVRVGDAVDFWRVEEVDPAHLLRLRAEMKVPGRAWLQFEVVEVEGGESELRQTAFFAPKGLWGLLYWYLLYPIHGFIFSRMVENLARQAESDPSLSSAGTGEVEAPGAGG